MVVVPEKKEIDKSDAQRGAEHVDIVVKIAVFGLLALIVVLNLIGAIGHNWTPPS